MTRWRRVGTNIGALGRLGLLDRGAHGGHLLVLWGLGRRGIDAHDGILPDRTWLCVGSGTDRHFHAIVSDVVSAIGFVGWPAMARLVRAEFLSLRTREFVIADEAL